MYGGDKQIAHALATEIDRCSQLTDFDCIAIAAQSVTKIDECNHSFSAIYPAERQDIVVRFYVRK